MLLGQKQYDHADVVLMEDASQPSPGKRSHFDLVKKGGFHREAVWLAYGTAEPGW